MHTRIGFVAAIIFIGAIAPFAAPVAAQSGSAVGFGDAKTTTTQGDIATIELQLRNTDQATFSVRSADQQYRAMVRVQDGDGDGTVNVRFNTFRGLSNDGTARFTAAGDSDTVELIAESSDQTGSVLDTGRYNMIVSTASTSVSAVLQLEAPGDTTSDSRVVAPETPFPDSDVSVNESSGSTDMESGTDTSATSGQIPTAAAGDHVRTRFSVSGLGGAVEQSPPARNLVFPANSAPNARTTHTMQTSPNQTIAVRSLTIDYSTDETAPSTSIFRLTQNNIDTLGVDETGNGYVDRSNKIAIQNIQTSTDGHVTLTFDRPITVSETDRLLAVYEVQNPDALGSKDVTVTLAGESTTYSDSGTVLYGPAGQGTLGNGIDLRLHSSNQKSQPTAPLSALDVTYDTTAGDLVTATDTKSLSTGEYAIQLRTDDSTPSELPQVNLTEQFEVIEPDAEFTNHSINDESQLSVTLETNLAPENTLIVRVDAQEPDGGISQVLNCVGTVESDGTVSCAFDLSKPVSAFDVDVSVRLNDTVLAEPTRLT